MCTPLTLEEEWVRGAFGTVYVVNTEKGKVAVTIILTN
jgi:hypothetical protein